MFVTERLEEFVVEVADLFLCDGGKRVNRVKPGVELGVLSELREAGILELSSILDAVNLTHETGSAGEDISVVLAEIVYVIREVGLELDAVGALGVVGERSELAEKEVASVEALRDDDTH